MSSKWRVRLLALLLLLFCLGAAFAAGLVVDRIYLFHHGRVLPPGGARFITHHLANRLDRALYLDDAQEVQVREILDRRRERILGDCSNLHHRFHQELREANREISAILTPQQRTKFERMHRHWK